MFQSEKINYEEMIEDFISRNTLRIGMVLLVDDEARLLL
jgi:hypothetical protein